MTFKFQIILVAAIALAVLAVGYWHSTGNQTAEEQGNATSQMSAGDLSKMAKMEIRVDDIDLVKEGSKVYADNCASCHGADLAGEPNWRQRKADGTLPAPPHNEEGHTWHHADGLLFAITKYGGQAVAEASGAAPGSVTSGMPGFEGNLSDRQIMASLAFIKSTWPPEVVAQQARITKQSQ